MADKRLPIETGLKANALLPKGKDRLLITKDSAELFFETAGVVTKLTTTSIRGSDITVAPSSWVASGEDLTVTINDTKVPAENSFYEYQVNIFWDSASIKLMTGSMITETTASGGSYKLILGSDSPPEGNISGQVTISRISKAW